MNRRRSFARLRRRRGGSAAATRAPLRSGGGGVSCRWPAVRRRVAGGGPLARLRLLRLQAESTLHLHPALVPENFCISSLECQAAGTPTITSNVGAMTTTVVDGSTGICIPAEPAASFVERYVERTLEIWAHPEDLAAMASRARARAIEEFDYATVARQWAAVIV